jgi:hypothetical protein|nr:MAG TPA: hypothetical protein [Caudoviricetes sp.]
MYIEKYNNSSRILSDTFSIIINNCNRSDIIDTIIRERYSASQVEAIVNNYLSDTTNEEYLKEFNDMQEWRKEAKSIAKKVNDFIQENDLINKPDGVYEIKE